MLDYYSAIYTLNFYKPLATHPNRMYLLKYSKKYFVLKYEIKNVCCLKSKKKMLVLFRLKIV